MPYSACVLVTQHTRVQLGTPTWIIILGCYRVLAQKDGLPMDQASTVYKQFWEAGASAHLPEDGGKAR